MPARLPAFGRYIALGFTLVVAGTNAASAETPAAIPDDAQLDVALLRGTALTQPAGSWTFGGNVQGTALSLGVAHAFTDRFQAGFSVAVPTTEGSSKAASVSVRGQVYAGPSVHLAVEGGVGLLRTSESFMNEGDTLGSVNTGLILSRCFGPGCDGVLSGSVNYGVMFGEDDALQVITYGASFVQRIASRAKVLLELSGLTLKSNDRDFEKLDGFQLDYGLRLFTSEVSGTVGLSKFLGGDFDDRTDFGIPYVTLRARWR